MRGSGAGMWRLLTVALVLLLGACQRGMGGPQTSLERPETPPPLARTAEPEPSPRPFGGLPIQNPFPAATTTAAGGQALLWSPWPMEGRDLQRTGRSPIVGPAQPRLAWSVEIDPPSFSQTVVGSDGTLYVGTATGRLLSVGSDGKLAWSFATTGPLPSPAVGPDGTVYLRDGRGALLALRSDGQRKWTTEIGADPVKLGPAPLVGPDRYTYLASYHSDLVYLVQPGGFFEWAYNAHARVLAGPAVGVDGTVYFGTADAKVYAVERELVLRWVADAGGPVLSPPSIGPDGAVHVIVGGSAGGLLTLDLGGRKRWLAPRCWEEGAPALWPAVALDGRVQVANCAIGRDGHVLWRAPVEEWATPAALDADGNAYFGVGRMLMAFDARGALRWSFNADGEVGPPSLGAYGTLIFTTRSKDCLYLLGR